MISLPLQGLDALAKPLSDAWQPAVWAAGFGTSWGSTVAVAVATLVAGLFALTLANSLVAKALALLAIAGIGVAFSASGHASTTGPWYLGVPAIFIHAVCITFWIGSLVPLAMTLRAGDRVALERFSRLIPVPLSLLIATGFVLAIVSLDRVDALWTTNYGLVLSAKLALVVVLLMLAAVNRYMLVPRLSNNRDVAPGDGHHGRIRARGRDPRHCRPLAFHAAAALAGRRGDDLHPFSWRTGDGAIDLTPERDRGASVSIAVTDDDFHPVAAKEVTLVIWNPGAGIEPIRRNAVFRAGAQWSIDGLRIPIAGVWRMRIEILINDFDKVMIEDNVELPRAP